MLTAEQVKKLEIGDGFLFGTLFEGVSEEKIFWSCDAIEEDGDIRTVTFTMFYHNVRMGEKILVLADGELEWDL